MKDGKTQSQIATLMDRHKSTISRELARNTGLKGYRPKQACLLAEERSLGSRNAAQINPKDWDKTVACLHKKWSPEQIADQVGISHETIYRHVYADKAAGGSLWEQLRCQKKRKKRYASWQRGSNENFNGLLRQYIPKKRPLSTVTNQELRMIQQELNSRPRKRLGFKTPNEVFMQSLNRVALRV
jgi:IS30 family transposase